MDKPLIQYAVEEAVGAGIDTLIFVTGRNKRAIEDHFDANSELEYAPREKGQFAQLKWFTIFYPKELSVFLFTSKATVQLCNIVQKEL